MKQSCSCGPACECKNCSCGPQAMFFETLGNESRLYIIRNLRAGPKSVSNIVQSTQMEQTLVSHNLRKLEDCGLVKAERQGKYRLYSLNMDVEPLMQLIDRHVKQHCTSQAKPCCCAPTGKTTNKMANKTSKITGKAAASKSSHKR
jgi:DNA-binding transcriptional ArsR family regulator